MRQSILIVAGTDTQYTSMLAIIKIIEKMQNWRGLENISDTIGYAKNPLSTMCPTVAVL